MNEKDKKLLMIFKLTKYKEEFYEYNFDSLALAIKFEDDFIINAGECKGEKLSSLIKIIDDGNMLLNHESNVSIDNPQQYVYYEVPKDLMYKLKTSGIKDTIQIYISICTLGDATELIWNGIDTPTQFTAIKNNSNNYTCRSEDDIMKMLFGESVLRKEDFNIKLNKENQSQIKEQPNSLKKNLSSIDVNQVIRQVKNKIVGQDTVIESVALNIYANQRLIDLGNKDLLATQKTSILLDGPTGTGKTAIMKEIADIISLPIVITSSTAYSGTGYVGSSLTDILETLLIITEGNIELAQRGIVCFDEFDKLAQKANETNELKMKTAIQQELLTFIGGAEFDITYEGETIKFDTSNLTIIGMGAFTKLREEKIKRKLIGPQKRRIGFYYSEETNDIKNDNTYIMTEQDYIDFGLERELVARFPLLISTKAYTIEDYKNILLRSTISPLKMFIEFVKIFGIESVAYDSDFIQMMAEMAYRDNFGARGLQKIVTNLKNSLLLDIINSKIKTIYLTTEMLRKSEEKNIKTF